MKANEINFSKTDLVRSICEDSYFEFFNIAWGVLEPTTKLISNWHIKYLCDMLQAEVERIVAGKPKDKDIIINIPPRSLKSSITTVYLNAWAWIKYPHLKFITASYNQELANSLSMASRRLIESDWYHKHFGHIFKLTTDQNTKSWFENNNGGMRKAVGVGSGITGMGADVICVDDALNPQMADSEAERINCLEWYDKTLFSRLNNQDIGIRIVIMQRLHQNDLTGHLLNKRAMYYKHICIPVENTELISPKELVGNYVNGLFFPKRFPASSLPEYKSNLGAYGYSGQMLQSPSPKGGGIIKQEWWKYYTDLPNINHKVWSWDTAVKTGTQNDYSVGILFGEAENGYYVIDFIRGKWEYPELKRMVQACNNKHIAETILIEDKSSGQQLIQDLKRGTNLPIINFKTDRDKKARVRVCSGTIESGRVFLPENASWLVDFLKEFNNFPNAKNDDIVDATTQGLIDLNNKKYITVDVF